MRPEPVKFNEAGPDAQNSKAEKGRGGTEKETEGGSKERQKDRKANKETKKTNSAKNQENQKEEKSKNYCLVVNLLKREFFIGKIRKPRRRKTKK